MYKHNPFQTTDETPVYYVMDNTDCIVLQTEAPPSKPDASDSAVFNCFTCQRAHNFNVFGGNYKFVCWIKEYGQCPSKFMTCQVKQAVEHKKTHPPMTEFYDIQHMKAIKKLLNRG